ncbi:hypothetical protein Pmani_024779 [Petrolisthes manimaculis]|uniref:Uncharacterized protein n=1 Tax=Petrolisthes manimaculis TaxID=1843537 RepID=A0AAE1U1U9_9EUCA|nr:hypothetical protein Pmani_024777 [Petrolisthes manimaculis]KAK4303187.1 hypothetical protein Pmani_024779 [Petrolisthes manimaculis]
MCPTRPQRTLVLSHVSNQTSEDFRNLRGLPYEVMCPTRPQRTPVLSHVSNQTSEDSRTKSCVQPDLRGLSY